jgi:hypothetical protein
MNLDLLLAYVAGLSEGEFWTIVAIVAIVLILGVIVTSDDTNWFD